MATTQNNEGKNKMENKMENIINEVIASIESKTGYRYNKRIVEETCEAGIDAISVGTVLYNDGEQTVEMGEEQVITKCGTDVMVTPLTDDLKVSLLKMWAEKKAQVF